MFNTNQTLYVVVTKSVTDDWNNLTCCHQFRPPKTSLTTHTTMSISFDEAVASLQAMFPEWDKEMLSMILESNQYHVRH